MPYPRPGKLNVKVRLGIVPAAGGETTWINWDKARYEYLARVHAFDGAPLTIQVMSRDQRELSLLEVDAATGATRELHHEHDDAWINLATGDQRRTGGQRGNEYRWLPGGNSFLWPTERNGAWQLELHGRDGALVRAITQPALGLRGLRWMDPAGRSIIVTAGATPVEQQLYEVSLPEGEVRALTSGPGFHDAVYAARTRAHVRHVARLDALADDQEVVRADGSGAGLLPSVAEQPPALPRVSVARVGEGEGFYTALVRPRDFDPQRKYPVWLSVYGGPGVTVVAHSARRYVHEQWIADHGFLVVKLDNRGTPWRGRAWERAIQDRFAEVPLQDQIAGLQALAQTEPAMDLSRVGVTGGSYGGFLSALCVLRRPDVFKAAVATSLVSDWLDYDTFYTERYLGVPGKDDTVYARNGLLGSAAGLSRPLLIIHGTADDNVHFSHSLKLADALFHAGRPYELIPVAGVTHQVTARPDVRLQYWRRVFEFFHKNL
jgi:dipeptidyl-peptidase-4